MPDPEQLEIAVEKLDSEHRQTKHVVEKMHGKMAQLEHDLRRLEERREDDRQLLIEIKESIASMGDQFKSSVAAVHKRVDDLKEKDAVSRGVDQGRKEARIEMFKWIGAIVALIAIVGYIGSQQSKAQPIKPVREEEQCQVTNCQ